MGRELWLRGGRCGGKGVMVEGCGGEGVMIEGWGGSYG